jgi:hypothetical protein
LTHTAYVLVLVPESTNGTNGMYIYFLFTFKVIYKE